VSNFCYSMSEICINLVFEDALHRAVIGKMLAASRQTYHVGVAYPGGGFGWIKARVNGFNNAAKGMPYFVLTDLDTSECPPVLVRQWLRTPRHPNLLFRVAVREVEAWLLGCRESFAAFLGVPEDRIPAKVEGIPNPKEFVVNLARRSRKRYIRMDIVPRDGSTAKVGPDYNGRLISYVESHWDPGLARERSPSLQRAVEVIDAFEPVFENPRN
jgi:hypothetical protein